MAVGEFMGEITGEPLGGTLTTLHMPVPEVAALAASVVFVPQTCCVVPALDAVGAPRTVTHAELEKASAQLPSFTLAR